jgi:hypothetical protein
MSDMQFVIADGTKKVHQGDSDRATYLASHLELIRALFTNEQGLIGVKNGRCVFNPSLR